MKSRFIEATQANDPFNWGKFLLIQFEHQEWQYISTIAQTPLLVTIGYNPALPNFWMLDLQTHEGAHFQIGGLVSADLDKKQVWVCPLFEPMLQFIYDHCDGDIDHLPDTVALQNAPPALAAPRRPGRRGKPKSSE